MISIVRFSTPTLGSLISFWDKEVKVMFEKDVLLFLIYLILNQATKFLNALNRVIKNLIKLIK